MERNRNWQGWVAIALAGMALLVALGGRGPWNRDEMRAVATQPPPAAMAAPAAPGDRFERPFAQDEFRAGPSESFHGPDGFRDGPDRDEFFHGGPQRWEQGFGHGPHGFGLFGLFGLLGGLMKLVAFGLLAWLLLRVFNQRRNTPPAAPTTPAGHDPRVE